MTAAALPVTARPATAQQPAPDRGAPADSLRRGELLQYLQREDTGFYEPDIFELNRALADSGLAALDSLGIDAFERETFKGMRRLRFDIEPAPELTTYNRVEGPVIGLAPTLTLPALSGAELRAEAAWATSSEKFRHLESLTLPLLARPRAPVVEAGYADRVVPYGSNRPTANSLRALVGSADEQDYLHRRGGWGELRWSGSPLGDAALRYEAARERSIKAHTDFAVFGPDRLMAFNAPVDEGIDRAATAELDLGSLVENRRSLRLAHRVAGGSLGGDFTYTRFEAAAACRRFLPGSFEAVIDAGYTRVGGDAPVQRLADVGGLSTVRGFDRRSRVGREALTARVELLVPYDLFGLTGIPFLRKARLQFVPWADAGRVWDEATCGCGAAPEPWLISAGLGLQYYLGPFGKGSYLRLDTAAPLGPDRPDDVRFYLGFARGLF
jgi:hypothetical protein